MTQPQQMTLQQLMEHIQKNFVDWKSFNEVMWGAVGRMDRYEKKTAEYAAKIDGLIKENTALRETIAAQDKKIEVLNREFLLEAKDNAN